MIDQLTCHVAERWSVNETTVKSEVTGEHLSEHFFDKINHTNVRIGAPVRSGTRPKFKNSHGIFLQGSLISLWLEKYWRKFYSYMIKDIAVIFKNFFQIPVFFLIARKPKFRMVTAPLRKRQRDSRNFCSHILKDNAVIFEILFRIQSFQK